MPTLATLPEELCIAIVEQLDIAHSFSYRRQTASSGDCATSTYQDDAKKPKPSTTVVLSSFLARFGIPRCDAATLPVRATEVFISVDLARDLILRQTGSHSSLRPRTRTLGCIRNILELWQLPQAARVPDNLNHSLQPLASRSRETHARTLRRDADTRHSPGGGVQRHYRPPRPSRFHPTITDLLLVLQTMRLPRPSQAPRSTVFPSWYESPSCSW